MKISKKPEIKRLATAFLLATFFLVASSTGALAASNQSQTTYPTDDENIKGMLYSNNDRVDSSKFPNDLISPEIQKQVLEPTLIRAVKQPNIDRSDPNNKLLEKTGQIFKDADTLLTD